ncbi:MAG: PAS domain S-box protein [Nitrospirota bacterium]
MDLAGQFFRENSDIVFFIYGLAFLVMGVAILLQPRRGSEIRIAGILWILAAFAIIHAINEFLDMWAIIKGRSIMLDIIRFAALFISYCFLFEFGRQLFRMTKSGSPAWQKKISGLLVWWLLPAIGFIIYIFSLMSPDFWLTGSIWTRYLLGFPGSLLIGSGIFLYYKNKKTSLGMNKVKNYFLLMGASFLIYGILGGSIVPAGEFFPSSWLNTDSFFSAVGIPVKVFRACCAITALWAVTGMLTVFNIEIDNKLMEAQSLLKQQLSDSEEKYMELVESSADMIYSVDNNSVIVFMNKQCSEVLGFDAGEITGRHIREIFPPATLIKLENALERLEQKGIIFIDDGKIIKKNGELLRVEINLMSTYDSSGKSLWTRIIVRDITEKDNLNRELKERVRELEEFYDIAVEREIKMIEIKEEAKRLKAELEKFKA